jgi:hypothetical protein
MQTSLKYKTIAIVILILAIAGCPKYGMAQRFNHGGASGGGFRPASPAPRPAAPPPRPAVQPSRPVVTPRQVARPVEAHPVEARPAEGRPVEGRPVEERPVEERPTINGGARNVGNHDLSRPADVHTTVNVRQNVTVRDHVNVYHTGAYRGIHPYQYHPYRPYYWGPHWHPLGFFLSALAADAILFNFNNQQYYFDDGCFYLPSNGGYSVVPAPVGAVVASLPPGYETCTVGDQTYEYFGGVFYVYTGQGYQVVVAPPGAVITELPVGAVDQSINGVDLLVYNNTYYQPISQDGQDAYEVVPGPGN